MAIRAYAEDYLAGAQRVLGDAVDFAVMTLGVEPDVFGRALAVADAAKQFADGNPAYVAGMNGCEFARLVLAQTGTPFADAEDEMFVDKGPEFWAGWALAWYQWYSGRSFMEILGAVPLESILGLYPTYHEMDIMQFADVMDERMRAGNPSTRLHARREACGFSQSQLAADSGVALRQIQLFEQRQRDINKAAGETLLRLRRSLHCSMEDLMEPVGGVARV